MKVKIRNYANWVGPYQLVEDYLFGWAKVPDEYGISKVAPEWVHNIAERFADSWLGGVWARGAEIVYRWQDNRRVRVQIHKYDTWSMDSTLAYIVTPMLIQLKATKHGVPFTDRADAPDDPQYDDAEEGDGFSEARWDWMMDEMIFAFDSKLRDWEEQFYSGEIDNISVPVDKEGHRVSGEDDPDFFGYRMDKGPGDTFEVDREGMAAYQARIDNGFRLFGKYYNGLWD